MKWNDMKCAEWHQIRLLSKRKWQQLMDFCLLLKVALLLPNTQINIIICFCVAINFVKLTFMAFCNVASHTKREKI